GARVRCPGCTGRFTVGHDSGAEDSAVAVETGPEVTGVPEDPEAPLPAATAAQAEAVARSVVERLAARLGPEIAEAHARGHLFAEFGRTLIAALDEYRGQAGPGAGVAAFRAALR